EPTSSPSVRASLAHSTCGTTKTNAGRSRSPDTSLSTPLHRSPRPYRENPPIHPLGPSEGTTDSSQEQDGYRALECSLPMGLLSLSQGRFPAINDRHTRRQQC